MLHLHSPISRSEIARRTGLTRVAVTNIINEFIEVGLVESVGYESTSLGRKKELLRLKADAFYVIGVDLSRDRIKVGLFDTRADVKKLLSSKNPDNRKKPTIKKLYEMIEETLKSAPKRDLVYGIGIGAPGLIDYDAGILVSSPKFSDWKDVPLRDMLSEKFNMKVWIDNDANVSALGEKWFGRAKGYENFVFLISDIGLGAGIVTDGRIYRGSLHSAGEIGHVPLYTANGTEKLEDLSTLLRLPKLYKERTGKSLDIDEILSLAENGETAAREAVRELSKHSALAVLALVNLLSPEMVVLGGRLAYCCDVLLEEVRKVLKKFLFSLEKPKIVISKLGENIEVMGAAALVLENLISDPYEMILKR